MRRLLKTALLFQLFTTALPFVFDPASKSFLPSSIFYSKWRFEVLGMGVFAGLMTTSWRHGNHCGLNYGSPFLPATDSLDRCCYFHDKCIADEDDFGGPGFQWHMRCHEIVSRCITDMVGFGWIFTASNSFNLLLPDVLTRLVLLYRNSNIMRSGAVFFLQTMQFFTHQFSHKRIALYCSFVPSCVKLSYLEFWYI